jgi:hypothetical protein
MVQIHLQKNQVYSIEYQNKHDISWLKTEDTGYFLTRVIESETSTTSAIFLKTMVGISTL